MVPASYCVPLLEEAEIIRARATAAMDRLRNEPEAKFERIPLDTPVHDRRPRGANLTKAEILARGPSFARAHHRAKARAKKRALYRELWWKKMSAAEKAAKRAEWR